MHVSTRIVLTLLAAITLQAQAQEVLTAGPERFIGAPETMPWSDPVYRQVGLATGGDEVLVVWSDYRGVYASRLDREGRPFAEIPTLLAGGGNDAAPERLSSIGVVVTGDLYTVFYAGIGARLHALRVTRELEVVERRTYDFPVAQSFNVVVSGGEIFLTDLLRVVRLGFDLTIRETRTLAEWAPMIVADSPRGPVLLTGGRPALTARFVDSEDGDVRVGSVENRQEAADMVWTGSELVVVWMDCGTYSCQVRTARLDGDLRPLGEAVVEPYIYCHVCSDGVNLAPLGDDAVLVTWQSTGVTWAQRFRKGVALDAKPLKLGSGTVAIRTGHGLLLAVDDLLRAGVLPPPGAPAGSFSPAPTVRIAAAQSVLAAGSSDDEIAIVWRNRTGKTAATILARDGTSREIGMTPSLSATVSSDGHDLYALSADSWFSYFQKLDGRSEPGWVDVAAGMFAWADLGFLAVRRERYDPARNVYDPPALVALDRGGALRDVCPQQSEPRLGYGVIVRGEGETLLLGPKRLTRVRGGCAGVEESEPLIPWPPRVAWHGGRWASLFTNPAAALQIAIAREGGPFIANPRPIFDPVSLYFEAAITGAGGRWIVLAKTGQTLRMALLDLHGNVIFRDFLADDVAGTPYLVTVSDREVLAVYEQFQFTPPYLGQTRVVVRSLTVETATPRRRTVRH